MNRRSAPQTATSLLVLALLAVGACSDDPGEPAAPVPIGTCVEETGCLLAGAKAVEPVYDRATGYVLWSYDAGARTLRLDHVHAGLNCCPDYTAAIEVAGTSLRIVETESVAGCHCLCLFRFGFEVTDLPPGVYELTVAEEYLEAGDAPLAGVIDLTQATSGRIEAWRGHHPWEMPN